MKKDTRISSRPYKFAAFMDNTDDLQLTVVTPPSTHKFDVWKWTSAESAQWTTYRQTTDTLFALYTNKDKVGPAIRRRMKELMNEVRAYDNDPSNGHHLLDCVAKFGTVDDCEVFNVKKGTVLARRPSHGLDPDPEMKVPQLGIRVYDVCMHLLAVIDPDEPKKKGLPEGIKAVNIYRYIGKDAPASVNDYNFAGVGKRGLYLSKLPEGELTGGVKIYAWYIACYQSSKGVLGKFCSPLRLQCLGGD